MYLLALPTNLRTSFLLAHDTDGNRRKASYSFLLSGKNLLEKAVSSLLMMSVTSAGLYVKMSIPIF